MQIKTVYTVTFPRSGGTALYTILSEALETPVERIPETDKRHPIHGHGLLTMRKGAFFIVLNRAWDRVYSSFLTARFVVMMGLKEQKPTPMPDLTGVAKVSDERYEAMKRAYEANLSYILRNLTFTMVAYEMLDDERYLTALKEDLELAGVKTKDNFVDVFLQKWRKEWVRGGAGSYGVRVEKTES